MVKENSTTVEICIREHWFDSRGSYQATQAGVFLIDVRRDF